MTTQSDCDRLHCNDTIGRCATCPLDRPRYRTIVADPPWPYDNPGAILRPSREARPIAWKNDAATLTAGSARRYGQMSMEELLALRPPADENAHLYLWTTNAFVCHAHDLARAWGFRPITILTWMKTSGADGRVSAKAGYYFRGATEHVVFGVRGSLPLQTDHALPTGFLWPREAHSVKPDAFYDLVEQASPGPYLEMFARRARFGWSYWGNESLGTAEMSSPYDHCQYCGSGLKTLTADGYCDECDKRLEADDAA